MKCIKLFILLLAFPVFAQQGGMWIPSLLEGMNETEMQALGMKMTAEDIYSVNQSSLKDAIVHFNGGCTAEVISNQGLILTNHHCGYGQIQSHSTVEHDYLTDGFWATSQKEELKNPGLSVTFIKEITDVTSKVLNGIETAKTEVERQKIIKKNITQLVENSPKKSWQTNRIKAFYNGNQYMLFRVETFKDVRLVGAPPSSIGKFGSDTDNWMWPRHTGDFSLFRIYADKNNRPAEYAESNIPYQPKHHLPISLDGVEQDDFTLVFGFPGRTSEYLPAIAVEQLVNVINPARIKLREAALKEQDVFMRNSRDIKIKYASKYAGIANYYKKWIGENQGLKKSKAIAIKKEQEQAFLKRVKAANLEDTYEQLLRNFDTAYKDFIDYNLAYNYFSETFLRNVELLRTGFQLYQLEQVLDSRGEQAFKDRKQNLLTNFKSSFKNYSAQVDQKVFKKVISIYAEGTPPQFLPDNFISADKTELTTNLYNKSALTSFESLKQLLMQSNPQEVIKALNQDEAYQLVKELAQAFYTRVLPEYQSKQREIQGLQKQYMKALLELSPKEDRLFPDANSTLRVTYGKVKGYSPKDAIYYEPVSYLEGVIEKYVPGDYEFDVPQKLIELYQTKDYGDYGQNGKMPVNFIGTNHTTGGNSGSPVIDAKGNLIGLNFDRVWEGTMSDIYYDPSISRNIMVDARYILFIIDKYAGAQHLIEEMTLVHPKK